MEAICAAVAAGLAAVLLQPDGSSWRRVACAFGAAALPVLLIHGRHGQTASDPPGIVQ